MSAFTALVTPKRHGVGFYAGQTPIPKMFAANGTIGTQNNIAPDASTFTENTNARITRASARPSNLERELEFGRHVAVGWHVAVDFETNADFN